MSKKIDHIDDTVSSFFSFMHMVISVGLNGMQKNMALTMLFARTTLKCRPGYLVFFKAPDVEAFNGGFQRIFRIPSE